MQYRVPRAEYAVRQMFIPINLRLTNISKIMPLGTRFALVVDI
jgi:hypothetical protein